LQDEKVRVVITSVKRNYARGRLADVICASPLRADPSCPIYGRCGGCQIQHAKYEAQLSIKRSILRDALIRIGGFPRDVEDMLDPSQGSPSPLGYRNKAIVPVRRTNGRAAVGFYEASSHRVVPLKGPCPVMSPLANRCLRETVDQLYPALRDGLLPPYFEGKDSSGLLREIVVRTGERTQEALVTLITRDRPKGDALEALKRLWGRLRGIEDVVGLSVFKNRSDGNFVWNGSFLNVWGRSSIREVFGGLSLFYDPTSFFQVNTSQAEAMFLYVRDLLDAVGAGDVLELYCGVGSLTCILAASGRRVVAVEEWPHAVKWLRRNLEANGLCRMVRPVQGSAEHLMGGPLGDIRFEAVVLDPPRGGCDPSVLRGILQSGVEHVIYVSCSPATLARDLRLLCDNGYALVSARPFDMFPQTYHVECVVLMTRL